MTTRACLCLVLFISLLAVPWTIQAAPERHAASERHGDKTSAAAVASEPVNINTADAKQLMTLDGIGHKVAEKIVEYRQAHGPFKKPEEIRKVDGIGGGLWEKNRNRIVIK